MTSFIIRQIDPDFWARVRAKADAEGTTVKAVILRLLAAWLAAVLLLTVTACGAALPTQPTVDQPKAGVPVRLELGVVSGIGTATLSAKVVDAFATALPHQTVNFVTSAGTFSVDTVETNEKGIATTTVTAPAGSVTITATTAGIVVKTLAAIQPPAPALPPPSQPRPPDPPPTVPVQPPAYFVTVTASPSTLQIGESTTITAAVSATAGSPPIATFEWDCSGTAEAPTAAPVHTCTYAFAGTFTVRVTVRGGAVSAVGTVSVVVQAPAPPPPPPALTVTLTSSAPDVAKGSTLDFTATTANLNGESVTAYQWDLDDTAGFEGTSTSNTRTSAVYTTAGLFTARVKVTTSTGRTATGTVNYVVTN